MFGNNSDHRRDQYTDTTVTRRLCSAPTIQDGLRTECNTSNTTAESRSLHAAPSYHHESDTTRTI